MPSQRDSPIDLHPQPEELTSSPLGRTPRSRSWLWPAAAVLTVLGLVVGVGRLGMSDSPNPVPPPLPQASDVALLPTSSPVPDDLASGPPSRATPAPELPVANTSWALLGPPIGVRFGTGRFDDGIPLSIGGTTVIRVREVAALTIGTTVNVGGWYYGPDCSRIVRAGPCPPPTISDVPSGSPRIASLVLSGLAVYAHGEGARVFRAMTEADPECNFIARGRCQPVLSVIDSLWVGDDDTNTTPIRSTSVVGALAIGFPGLDFRAFEESSSCPADWPVQSYVVSSPNTARANWSSLQVRLVLVFPSTGDRMRAAPALRASVAGLTPFDASNRCVAIPGGVDDNAWVTRDNVMVLLGSDTPGVRSIVDTSLSVAQSLGV